MESLFNRSPLYLYSKSELPPAGITQCDLELQWFANDTVKRYAKEPHPLFKEDDISYRFNSKGYRCAEFNEPFSTEKPLKVVSIGASEVFGVGLPEVNTFPHLFCEKLSKTYSRETINWNLGVSGGSADFMSRILYSVMPVLKPDIVLLVFPPVLRREYVNDSERLFIYTDRIGSYNVGKRILHRLYDPEKSRQNSAHHVISSDPSDQINFFKNYQLCEALCTKYDVMWLHSPFSDAQLQHARHLLDSDRLVLPGLLDLRNRSLKNKEGADQILARDLGHPGIKPNVEMANLFFNRLQQLYSSRLPEN